MPASESSSVHLPIRPRVAAGAAPSGAEKALLSIRQARDTVLARNLELTQQLNAARDRISELEDDRDSANDARDAALALVRELTERNDELRKQAADGREDEVPHPHDDAHLKEQPLNFTAALAEKLDAAERARDIALEATASARREIEHLIAEQCAFRSHAAADRATLEARLAAVEAKLGAQPEAEASDLPAVSYSASTDATDADATVIAMRGNLEALTTDAANAEVLGELDERFHGLAATAGGDGRDALARFSSACGDLTRSLRKTPRKVPAALDSLRGAVELISQLSSAQALIADPAGAAVYAVDDDVDNCECVTMSLEKLALQTRYAIKPEIALADFASTTADLIILDVDLPGMNGFELYSRIRQMEHHRETPVLFLSGHLTTKDRLASLGGGPRGFVPKPYNLTELGVIALAMVLRSRLSAAGA